MSLIFTDIVESSDGFEMVIQTKRPLRNPGILKQYTAAEIMIQAAECGLSATFACKPYEMR